ncbi:elongation factor G-like protein EF-G2 [Pseudonocardia sp. C8]|uniref:elongation factor G-like protein EF-G2 n=1 Tax=Pseudonocardia sp. C8 TaxID=2762759 RepID=UPI001643072A|nr:elongation factor G-like protein EF-G2 [Pseudonocardia sp. C8]MBC3192624.1 elongation factor G-like protein EF-G2 [Pseudonocardia sp. C8]
MAVKADRTRARAAGYAAVTDPQLVRNVALVGPSGSGKTTLAEALLAHTGTIPRAGSVTEGSTVCDHDPAATRQQRSVGIAVAPLEWNGITVNLVDTPGYGDYLGGLRAGLRAADAALFVVPAGQGRDGTLEPGTVALWEECAEAGIPRAVVVGRCDADPADVQATMQACRESFGEAVVPCYLPLRADDGTPTGLYGLLTQTPEGAAPADAAQARSVLIEGIIEQSEDEELMERYVAGDDVGVATLIDDLETAVARGGLHPLVPVDAAGGTGLDALLEIVTRAFPAPPERPLPASTEPGRPPLQADPDGPLVAEVVHTGADPYVGRICLVRVFSGTLRPETTVHVGGPLPAPRSSPEEPHELDERIGHVYSPLGGTLRETEGCVAGDLCAVTRLEAAVGDTLSDPTDPVHLVPWPRPEPLLPVAVVAHTPADEDAVARGLARLIATDPGLRLERDPDTRQTVLWCAGEAHADVALGRLRDAGAQVDVEDVRVAFRVTLAGSGRVTGRHVKQSGGHGQFAVCHVEFAPRPGGAGIEFTSAVVGGAVPTQYVPSVQKGILAQAERGLPVTDGGEAYPVVDFAATLVDGKAHSVDSSDAAFQTAGALALRAAAETCGLKLLEPVDEVRIRILDEHLGAVLGDVSGRRGKVLGTDPDGTGHTLVRAEVPRTELLRHAVDLRGLTAGTAVATRAFARYAVRPT